jgi:tetratricopeptide (TPR) repeat protein
MAGPARGAAAREDGQVSDWAIPIGLVLAIFAVYGQTLRFGFVNYDDPDYVTGNAHVRGGITFDGIGWAFRHSFAGNWFPLTWLSHMLDVQLYGLDAGLHHLTNIAIHALTAVLLFLVLLRKTKERWPSAMVAALFALHPLHVESVAWIAERKDVLSALFWVLTLGAYANYVARPSRMRYGLTLLAFALGLMAKPMLVTLPLVLFLLDYWPFARGWKVLEKLPFLALSGVSCVITFLVHREAGATASLDVVPAGLRIENALVSYAVYIVKVFWPSDLAVFYPYSRGGLALQAAFAGAALLAITVVAVRMAGKRPYLIFGWLWYLVTLVPVIGLLQVGAQARADRYTYIPLIGLSVAMVWGAAEVLSPWPRTRAGVGAAVCVVCAVMTSVQASYWQDGVALFRHAVEVTNDNYIARFNLAAALDERGEGVEAAKQLTEAVRIEPRFAMARAALGQLLAKQGEAPEALVQLKKALELSPSTASIHFRLATVLADTGNTDEAIPEFLETVRLDHSNADAYYNLGIARFQQGSLAEAAADFAEVVRLHPDDAPGHFNLGIALARLGRIRESIAEVSEAVRIQPDLPGAREALADAQASLGTTGK